MQPVSAEGTTLINLQKVSDSISDQITSLQSCLDRIQVLRINASPVGGDFNKKATLVFNGILTYIQRTLFGIFFDGQDGQDLKQIKIEAYIEGGKISLRSKFKASDTRIVSVAIPSVYYNDGTPEDTLILLKWMSMMKMITIIESLV